METKYPYIAHPFPSEDDLLPPEGVIVHAPLGEVSFYPTGHSASRGERSYIKAIRSMVRGYVTDVFDTPGFMESMYAIIDQGLSAAWSEGAKRGGSSVIDLPPEGQQVLRNMISTDYTHVPGFVSYLSLRNAMYLEGRKKEALDQAYNRAVQWTNRYSEVATRAELLARQDQKMIWSLGPIEHCDSCLTFSGRVYRASTWLKYNAIPRSWRLCCTGRHCQCRLTPAPDLPMTRGRFPEGALCN